ncbi:beta-1,4-N-acetylgalactosaminyltransferase bre-4-like [Adelges cooleyi]|uniref:beta-1,4-N-acetylgalactosaminyltransferase bre-4-like n=1 Tax=Adelges cooleyi TaxID=133065 RepID=UPI00217F748B|nr:beta-1,4-N-acetylgalactosaminyltransferase bre-4-like [Adelges cooleyi]
MIQVCKVKYEGEDSEEFGVGIGLRQGDALSPALFNIALESVMRETLDGALGIKMRNDQQLVLPGYADDVIIMAESEEDLKRTTSKLIAEGENIGLMDIDYFNVIPKPLELCPEVPPGLSETAPLIIPTIETLEGVGKNLSWLVIRHGGHNTPIDCISRYKIAIIVPYRDRLQNLCTFLLNIHLFLTKQQLDYTIFVVEQFDGKLFNRGMLMNVGFVEALKLSEFDCFFFHDVDLIPENENNIYSCPQQPRHMSVAVDKLDYKLPHDNIFGGVIGISRHHFQLVNGFSNRFWGWGGEDDDLASRVKFHDLHITRYPSNIARYRMLNHVQQAINPHRFELLLSGQKWFKTDGLNSLKYQIKSVERLPLYTHVLVDLTKS